MKKKKLAWLLAIALIISTLSGTGLAKADSHAQNLPTLKEMLTLCSSPATVSSPGAVTSPGAIDDDDDTDDGNDIDDDEDDENDDDNEKNPSKDQDTDDDTLSDSTIVLPTAPSISSIRGGYKKVKLTWSEMTDASGYKIYYSTSKNGSYKRIKTITSSSITSFTKTNLKKNKTYYFKATSFVVTNNLMLESTYSRIASAKTCSVPSTSKNAKLYTTKKKFNASPAYQKYEALSKKSVYSKSFAIPGMKTTNVGGFESTRMIPQGMCQAGGYILISAYDANKKCESVIYVMSRSSHSYITTIVLPSKAKVESLAYDGKNIWISRGSYVSYFPYSVVTNATISGNSYYELSAYTGSCQLKTSAGVMTYHDKTLWIGKSGSSASSKMYGYSISETNGKYTLTSRYSMTIPARTQGITFDKKGYLYLTRSNKTNPKTAKYISCIQTFKPSLSKPSKSGAVKKGKAVSKLTLPPKAEGIAIYGNYLYTLYSSCQYKSSKYPVDRVIATKLTKLR